MKLTIQKNGDQVGVYVEVPRKTKPVFVHRIKLHWTGHGSEEAFLINFLRPDMFVEEGFDMLVASMTIPNGAASVRAEACYEVVDGIATTARFQL